MADRLIRLSTAAKRWRPGQPNPTTRPKLHHPHISPAAACGSSPFALPPRWLGVRRVPTRTSAVTKPFPSLSPREVAESANNTGAGSTSYPPQIPVGSLSLPQRTLNNGVAGDRRRHGGLHGPLARSSRHHTRPHARHLPRRLLPLRRPAPTPASTAPPEPPLKEKEKEEEEEEEDKEEEEATVPFVYPDPVEVGEVTLKQLRAYDGKDPAKQILIAIRGQVYDVSRGRLFYGPQGSYSLFAGRDATRALALMSFDPNDLTGDLEGLSPDDLEVLQDWEEKFKERYPRVGRLATDSNEKAAPVDHEEGSS